MKISTLNAKDNEVCEVVWNGLLAYNQKYAQRNHKDFTISVKDKGKIVGGAIGESKFGWTILQYLWIHEDYRGHNVGSKLMKEVEQLAKRRRSIGVWLDTFSFQAPQFYRKLGYKKIGYLQDHPDGHAKYWFAKRIRG